MAIKNFNDFTTELLQSGFSTGGSNNEGIYSLCSLFDEKIQWHTGNPDTDPWEWRMLVLNERKDIAYSKVFFRKSGFITKEWYPYFLAVRRGNKTFEEEYQSGTVSQYAKRIYDVIDNSESLPIHEIKRLAGFTKEDQSKFERALVELQMKMYMTMCGNQQKISQKGQEYGWSSTVFCTAERFFDEDVFSRAKACSCQQAIEKITAQVLMLNPNADEKKINKFIMG